MRADAEPANASRRYYLFCGLAHVANTALLIQQKLFLQRELRAAPKPNVCTPS